MIVDFPIKITLFDDVDVFVLVFPRVPKISYQKTT